MSSTEDTDGLEIPEDEHAIVAGAPDALFGCYSVVSPGVEIIIDGRVVSAPAVH